jgi:hypothetical protein
MEMKRKAISPIVASLALIGVALLGGIIFLGAVHGWFSGAMKTVDISVSAKIVGNYAIVEVKNVGNQPVTIEVIRIDGTKIYDPSPSEIGGGTTLNPGQSIAPSGESTWTIGVTYTVNVTYVSGGKTFFKFTKTTAY